MDKDSCFSSSITFGKGNVRHLLFADNLALLSSNKNYFQYALDRFSDAGFGAGTKIYKAKTDIMCLSRHPVQTNRITLKQMEKFKYLRVTFSNDDKQTTNWTHLFKNQVQ